MPLQYRNQELYALARSGLQDIEGKDFHAPLDGFGVRNGDFDIRPIDQGFSSAPLSIVIAGAGLPNQGCEGWEVDLLDAGATVTHEYPAAGALFGYSYTGGHFLGSVGPLDKAGLGAQLTSWPYLPVNENSDYLIAAVANQTANGTFSLGAKCYDETHAYLGTVWAVNSVIPIAGPLAWTRYQKRIGPLGDVAWTATTRYARVTMILQGNAALTNAEVYADHVMFERLQPTYSPLITYTHGHVEPQDQNFTLQAYTLWNGSAITLTFEEPGYMWFDYGATFIPSASRAYHTGAAIYIDGALMGTHLRSVGGTATYYGNIQMSGRSSTALAVGAHTIDMRVYVWNAGDTINGVRCIGSAYYVRQN